MSDGAVRATLRIGFLADVHGNAPALQAALSALEPLEVSPLYFLGDAIGYMPGEVECLETLATNGLICQKGNHEAMLLSRTREFDRDDVYQLEAAHDRLSLSAVAWIRGWPVVRELEIDARRLLLVHGSPAEPLDGYLYPDTELSPYAEAPFDAIVSANTHRPFVRRCGTTVVVNVGSVGLPRDIGGLASMAIYDSDTNRFQIARVPFDVDELLRRWGTDLHEQVRACLRRSCTQFVGELIP